MFSIDNQLNMLQGMKRDLTNKLITDKELNKVANNFLDGQLAFGKVLSKTATDISEQLISSNTDFWFPKTE